MEPHSLFINVDGVKLHVTDWGGQGPSVFFTHGSGLLGYAYRLMLARLMDRYHVFTLDLRGHGDSEKLAPQHYHWQYLANDVAGVIEQLGLRDFYGIGHSGGGGLLALYAATHLGRVKRLALLEPIVFPHEADFLVPFSPQNHPLIKRAVRRRVIWESRQQLFAAYQGKEAFAAWREEALWDYINHGTYEMPDGRIALKCTAEVEAQMYANATSLDIFSQLNKIDCPVLVLRGEHTDEPIFIIAERAAQRIPQGSLVTVPDTSHFLSMEKPEEVGDMIGEFFRRQ